MSDRHSPTSPSPTGLRSLAREADRLARFRPPFAFGDFFSPEDTLLGVLATEWALERAAAERAALGQGPPERLIELTCGGGVIALAPLDRWPTLRTWGADVDPAAVARARANARALGVRPRARFGTLGLFDPRLPAFLRRLAPDVVACNPPYVPEPPGTPLALVAGAGADGARHPKRTLTAAARGGARRLALSWCSLGDPVGVVHHAARRGWVLEALWACVIADGEWTGPLLGYLKTLPTAWLDDSAATRDALGDPGSVRFAYLLLAGSFVRPDDAPAVPDARPDPAGSFAGRARMGQRLVARVVERFARRGPASLARLTGRAGTAAPGDHAFPPLRAFVCDRWDELALRAAAHGPAVGPDPG